MREPCVLSLVRFRPTRVAFDDTIRAAVERLVASGARHALAGRTGADALGERLLASVWADQDAIDDAIAAAIDLTALIDVACERVHLEIADSRQLHAGRILRLASGTVAAGGLMRYVAAARSGLEDDRRDGHGPMGLFLGTTGLDSFVTLSVWPDWATVQVATGADRARPVTTRHQELVTAFSATHYELLAGRSGATSRPKAVHRRS